LNTEIPGLGMGSHMDTSERHSNMYVSRNKEFWGNQGAENDVLTVNGTDIINAAISPLEKLVVAIFVCDSGADGKTDLTVPIPYFYTTVAFFISGTDLFIPAANPATGTISLVLTPRGGGGKTQVINVPNWVSTKDRISVQFNDFLQAE
jgi:hypothetical protein